jgi:hypothetical protein
MWIHKWIPIRILAQWNSDRFGRMQWVFVPWWQNSSPSPVWVPKWIDPILNMCVCVPGAHAPLKLLPQHLGFLGLFWCQILGTYQWMWGKKKQQKATCRYCLYMLISQPWKRRGTWSPVISTVSSSSRESLHMFHAYFKQGSQEPQSFFQDRCKE